MSHKSEYVWGGEYIPSPRQNGARRVWQRYMTITAPRSYDRMYWAFKDWSVGLQARQQSLGECWYEAAGRERYTDARPPVTFEFRHPALWPMGTVWL